MAVQEILAGEPDEAEDILYQEPGGFKRQLKSKEVPSGYRVCRIISKYVELEPLQEGVYRYPPVQVQVPRRPDFIEKYVSMGQTDWSSLLLDTNT
jgi:hypothetical protein